MRRPLRVSEPRLLVTGFPAFSNFESNISEEVLSRLEETGLPGIDVVTWLLSVDEDGSRAVAEQISDGILVDGILHLGLATRRDSICLERQARNRFSMRESDNSGRLRDSGEIVEGGPPTLLTTASIHVMDEEFEHDDNVGWSEDAGGYVCNETFYRTLLAIRDSGNNPIPALFVHLPPEAQVALDTQVDVIRRIAACLVSRPTYEVVGGMLFDSEGRILACKRPEGDAWAGWWEFPGGKIEAHEGPESALIRELVEEIGVSTKPIRRIEQTRYEYSDRTVNLQLWDCGVVDPDSIRLVEHDEVRWLSDEELLDVKWLPADLPIVERWWREGIPRG